jgi:hypothetical protein
LRALISRPSKSASEPTNKGTALTQRKVPHIPELTAATDSVGRKRAARDDVSADEVPVAVLVHVSPLPPCVSSTPKVVPT